MISAAEIDLVFDMLRSNQLTLRKSSICIHVVEGDLDLITAYLLDGGYCVQTDTSDHVGKIEVSLTREEGDNEEEWQRDV